LALAPAFVSGAAPSFIHDIKIDKNLLNEKGLLTDNSLAQLLAQATAENKIKDRHFTAKDCITAKSIPVVGSFNTVQLFRVTSTCISNQPASSFIVKEARNGLVEAESLRAIEEFPGIKELMAPKSSPTDLLSIALPLHYLSYGDKGGAKHYLTIMPLAQGRVLCDVIKEYRDNQTNQNAAALRQTFETIGKQLGNFERKFRQPVAGDVIGKTIVHGDFHCLNLFFDKKIGLTTIDNETAVNTLHNRAIPSDDILKLFLVFLSESPYEPIERRDAIIGIPPEKWYNTAFAGFVEGYASTYPAAERAQVYDSLKRIFNSNTLPSWLVISADKIKELRDKYINPILNKAK
jgi:hypothetical protein